MASTKPFGPNFYYVVVIFRYLNFSKFQVSITNIYIIIIKNNSRLL